MPGGPSVGKLVFCLFTPASRRLHSHLKGRHKLPFPDPVIYSTFSTNFNRISSTRNRHKRETLNTENRLRVVAHKRVLPLLQAILNEDIEAVWYLYNQLDGEDKLKLLLPEHHSLVLRSINVKNQLIDEELKTKYTKRLIYVIGRMKAYGYNPDVRDYTHLLHVFGSIKKYRECDKIWARMWESGLKPGIYAYNCYLYSCLGRHRGCLALASDIWRNLQNDGLNPNAVTYAVMIRIYGDLKMPDGARQIFDSAFDISEEHKDASKFTPTEYSFNSLLYAYGRSGELDRMKSAYELMVKVGVMPDFNTFGELIRWSCEFKDLEGVRAYIAIMQEQYGFQPNITIFNHFIKLAIGTGRTTLAIELFREMKEKYNLFPIAKMVRKLHAKMRLRKRYADAQHLVNEWIPQIVTRKQ
ncbi:8547_t:CDS:1 [Paraglomus brasilianum]|uniref:8547_t:CDS:1 n=1 Tax=Paraglomus brasilianum TaxID=144538 RepID=A0A9N9BKL0_9GLOM|nr:8547_t:CDS:1 [Paraglomus brasilianum]